MLSNTIELLNLGLEEKLEGKSLSNTITEIRALPRPYVLINFIDQQEASISCEQALALKAYTMDRISRFWHGMDIRIINVDTRVYKNEREQYSDTLPTSWVGDKKHSQCFYTGRIPC